MQKISLSTSSSPILGTQIVQNGLPILAQPVALALTGGW
jgi:hypothetical protein